MSEQKITIDYSDHGFTEPEFRVFTYDATMPNKCVEVDPSAVTVDPDTHEVTIRLATGEVVRVKSPEKPPQSFIVHLTPEQMSP